MTAREYFDGLRREVLRVEDMRQRVEAMRGACGCTGKASGTGGRVSGGDSLLTPTDREIDAERELERMGARLERRLEWATMVLYGRSGHGGVAAAKGSATADCMCAYYLMGYRTWADVAAEFAAKDSSNPAMWARMRAYRGLAYVDAVGLASLRDS